MGIRGELHSARVMAGKRTYFLNVKENRQGDKFLNIVESKKHGEEGYERHSVVVFQEDLKNFMKAINEAADYIEQNSDI